jgi:hypothetical protein
MHYSSYEPICSLDMLKLDDYAIPLFIKKVKIEC